MRKNNHVNAPFPEIVSGKPGWKIFEDEKTPHTSNLSKEMYVPLDNQCESCGVNHSKMIRRHELGHVKQYLRNEEMDHTLPYDKRPHEIEAHALEKQLTEAYYGR